MSSSSVLRGRGPVRDHRRAGEAAGAGQADRHAWRRRLPVGRPGLQAEARGEVPLHGFLDRRAAARHVRGRGRHQPAAGAGDLSWRGAGGQRLGGRDAPLRRGRPARPHGRARDADAGDHGGARRAHRALSRWPRADPRWLRAARRLSPFGRGRHPPDARAGRAARSYRPARHWRRRCRRRSSRTSISWRAGSTPARSAAVTATCTCATSCCSQIRTGASRCRSMPSSSPSASPTSTCSTTCRSR